MRGAQAPALVAQVHVRHILHEDERGRGRRDHPAEARRRSASAILKGESFEAIASVTSEDPGSAAAGGDLGWTGLEQLSSASSRKDVDTLDENEISQPFKTEYGWHIAQLLGRRTYDASADMTRNRCVAQLREARADEETEIWLRRLRDEAFVEYRM